MRLALKDTTNWHEWFAWRPVLASGKLVWLERVERRIVDNIHDRYGEYRLYD